MDKPLRILAIVNLPWEPRLGAARIYIELAEHWKAAGHCVEKFCLTDAFAKPTNSAPLSMLRQILFARQAARFVRRNGSRFDIIDALIGTLPFSKKDLRFRGLLVARSVGLHRSYERFIRWSQQRWPNQPRGKLLGRYFYRFTARWQRRNSELSLRHCDLINLPNADEIEFVRSHPAMVQPYGISENDRAALASVSQSPEARLNRKEICFIGMWSLRKGARDWGEIIRQIREKIPAARFKFLGTMTDTQTVLNDLRLLSANGVTCVETYDPGNLPDLIGPCAVGLFPSYIEGFGLAVLEQLASGIPTITYDVSGPRQILDSVHRSLLVPEGDAFAMAGRAVQILQMNPSDYAALSAECRSITDKFRWEPIAAKTAHEYRDELKKITNALE